GTRSDGDVVAADEFQAVADVGGPTPTGVDRRRDPDDLDARPTEQQRQRAGVVRVASEIGVEMNAHRRPMLRRRWRNSGALRLSLRATPLSGLPAPRPDESCRSRAS